MNSCFRGSTLALMLALPLALVLAPPAKADGTASGTPISNSASVDYKVGGVDQPQIVSNTATFVVDNKVDLTVTTVDVAIVAVVPGAVNQVLTYSVTNNGNTVQDYSLQALDSATGAFGETETFDATNVRVFVDSNSNGTYDPGVDTADYIDELAADVTITVFVVADIPSDRVDGDVASYDLIAQTAQGGAAGSQGADITTDDSGSPDDPDVVQIVFADGAGIADAANDGQHSSLDGYKVQTATLSVAKGASVISDPINGAVNPKAIPGATVEYTIDIDNLGTNPATDVIVVDAVPINTAFLVGSVSTTPAVGPTVDYSDDGGSTWTYVPVAGPDGSDPTVTHVRVTFANIANGASAQEVFQVLIQ
jgi:uncharacterized repeat protein (TIGR01451 family)